MQTGNQIQQIPYFPPPTKNLQIYPIELNDYLWQN